MGPLHTESFCCVRASKVAIATAAVLLTTPYHPIIKVLYSAWKQGLKSWPHLLTQCLGSFITEQLPVQPNEMFGHVMGYLSPMESFADLGKGRTLTSSLVRPEPSDPQSSLLRTTSVNASGASSIATSAM